MAGMPGDTPNMVTQPEPSGSTVPPEYAPSTSYGQEPQPSPGQNVPNPVAAEVSSFPPPQSNSGTGADLNNEDMAANYGHGRGATVPGVAGGGMPFADPSQLSAPHKRAHSLGTIFSAISGPQGTPGSFWRNILAGALTGAAAGAEAKMGGGVGSFAVGAGAQIKEMQAQKERDQKQQQQEFENQLKTKEEQRAESAETRADTLSKAQVGMYNAQVANLILDTQGKSFTQHQQIADFFKPVKATFEGAGIKPIPDKDHIFESDMQKFVESNPGAASSMFWVANDPVAYVDKSGNLNYQYTFSAYNKAEKIPVTADLRKQWEDSGLMRNTPGLKENLDKNPSLDFDTFTNLSTKNLMMKKNNQAEEDRKFQTEKNSAELTELRDRDLAAKASARASGDEATLREMAITDTRLQKSAKAKMNANPDAWTLDPKKGGLTPQEKVAYQSLYEQQLKDVRAELADPVLKSELGSEDPAIKAAAQKHAADLWTQGDEASSRLFPKTSKMSPYAGSAYGLVEGTPAAIAFDAVSSTQPDLNSARMALARIPPSKLSQENREKANRALVAHYGKAGEEKEAITNQTQQAAAENQGLSAPVPNVPYQPM
jgi:hypothetical protein